MNKIVIKRDQAYLYGRPEPIPQGQSQFSQIKFEFSDEWDGLRKIVQFDQGGKTTPYNVSMSNDLCFCPFELVFGWVNIRVKGYPEDTDSPVIATANEILLPVSMGFQSGGIPPVPPTPDLYQKLLKEFKKEGSSLPEMSSATKGQYLTNDGETAEWADVDALPAMSSDTVGRMLTNDGKNPEWADVPRETMCVSLTQGTDDKWSADKNWNDAATLIESGGFVYVMIIGVLRSPLVDYNAEDQKIVFTLQGESGSLVFSWKQDGTIEAWFEDTTLLTYLPQELPVGQQAQARKNIGAGTPYTLPIASPAQLGGVKPAAKKTDAMTRSIGVDASGGLWTEPAEVYYIDLEGNYPNYTCSVAMADIKAAYEAGNVLECRCAMGPYTATLPLFIPMPSANTWIFSGSGALTSMKFPAQSLTIAIVNGAVQASDTQLVTMDNIASPFRLGVVKPAAKKTDAMTRSIGVDASGGLWTEPAAWYVNITGTPDAPIGDKTPAEIYQAYTDGYAVYAVVQMQNVFNGMPFTLPLVAVVPASGSYLVCFSTLVEPHLAVAGILEITVTWNKRWYLYMSTIANVDDIPTALPNPNALTITVGDNVVSYDGSETRAITIPTGGSSGGETWELINTFEVAEADAARVIKIDKDSNGNAFSLKKFAFSANTNSTKTDGSVTGWFCVNGRGTYNSGLGGFKTNFVRHPSTGEAIVNDVIGRALPFGLVYDHTTGRKAVEGIVATSVTDVHEVEFAGYQFAENLLYGTFSLWGVRK